MPELNDYQFHRYARHLILEEIGEEGQQKLLAAKVLVIGAGGLGAPILLYLAAAGVGTLGMVDDDLVELSNLQRQIIHSTDRIGQRKLDSAQIALKALDPSINIRLHPERLNGTNVDELIASYDIVVDGSDNFETRYCVNDACVRAGKTLVFGAVIRFEGQVSTFKPHLGANFPCYRCLFPEPPPAGSVPRCNDAGILGSVAGVIGTLQATEVLKEILNLGNGLGGTLLLYDALDASFFRVSIPRDLNCLCCSV